MPMPKLFDAPSALSYFSALVSDDASLPLTEAALSIAHDDDPQLDGQAVLSELDTLAGRLKRRIPADANSVHKLRLLNRFFFHELGFGANMNNFYDAGNSYLHRVLATRRGIPISLAVIYIELASQLGLQAKGVSFPGALPDQAEGAGRGAVRRGGDRPGERAVAVARATRRDAATLQAQSRPGG